MTYRVAFITVHTSPLASPGGRDAGGMNVYVRQLSAELAARGLLVDVFTRRTSPGEPEISLMDGGVRLVRVSAGPARAIEKDRLPAYLDAFADGMRDFAAREAVRYELLHSHYWLSGWVAERLRQTWDAGHIAMFHTLGEAKNRSRLTEHEPLRRIDAERDIATSADRIVCASRHEKDLLVSLYGADPARVAVVPCGVDLDRFRPLGKEQARRQLGLRQDDRIILFVGRIEPLKGIDILIGAAAQLEDQPDFHVLIVGGDKRAQREMRELRELATGLGIGDRVCFVGAVDHEQLPLFYNAADVCVVPSYYESFGMVAVEAMACGTPVVASRVGGLAATVSDGETGYLIPWRCPEPFAERLEMLLTNDDLRRSLGNAAREAMERYRWSNVADAVIEIYEDVRRRRAPLVAAGAE